MNQENALAVRKPDVPLVTAQEAADAWQQYLALEKSILDDSDYTWSVEWEWWDKQQERARAGRATFKVKEKALACQADHAGSVLTGRKKKSAWVKLSKFYGLDMPETGMGEASFQEVAGFLVQTERGDSYVTVTWLDPKTLVAIKASSRVVVRTPSGRTFVDRGGAHRNERGFAQEDHDIPALSFTRALCRALARAIGYGDEAAEDVPEDPPPNAAADAKTGMTRDELRSAIAEAAKARGLAREGLIKEFTLLYPGVEPLRATHEQLTAFLQRLRNPAQESAQPQDEFTQIFGPPGAAQSNKRDPTTIKNLADLKRACLQDFGLQEDAVLRATGYSRWEDIPDAQRAYEQVAAMRA